jgi:cell division protein FtsB
MRASDRVTSQTVKLEEKKNQLAELESRLEYVNSYEFIEKEAREKLNLQRPGEIVLVVPETAPTILVEEDEKGEDLTNWQKWIKLFM